MRFLKSDRLLSERDFSTLLKKAHEFGRGSGSILHSSFYRIYRNPVAEKPRLGLAIGKKVLRNAVDRNRVKRVVREFFRENRQILKGEFLVKLDRQPPNFDFSTLTQPLYMMAEFSKVEGHRASR